MRSVGIAYIIWFLAPCLGIHRLYCGRIGTGLIYCFTGGLLFFGWFVDLFLIPDLVREANLREPPLFNPQPRPGNGGIGGPGGVGVAPANRVIYCTQCGGPMQVPANAAGMQYACPACRTVLQVPG